MRFLILIFMSLPLVGMQPPDPSKAMAKLKGAQRLCQTGQTDKSRPEMRLALAVNLLENSSNLQAYAFVWCGFCRLRLGMPCPIVYQDIMRYFRAGHALADQRMRHEIETLMDSVSTAYRF